VLTRVWRDSQHKGGTLLVLLAIADYAEDNGVAFPSVATLAKKARMTPRNVQYALRALERSGELQVGPPESGRKSNTFRVQTLRGIQTKWETSGRRGVQKDAIAPVIEPSIEPATAFQNEKPYQYDPAKPPVRKAS
jgi:helix-turn-helix protein